MLSLSLDRKNMPQHSFLELLLCTHLLMKMDQQFQNDRNHFLLDIPLLCTHLAVFLFHHYKQLLHQQVPRQTLFLVYSLAPRFWHYYHDIHHYTSSYLQLTNIYLIKLRRNTMNLEKIWVIIVSVYH